MKLTGADVVFSDNYFDIPAGQSIVVRCPIPDSWTVGTALNALKVYSLYDSFV